MWTSGISDSQTHKRAEVKNENKTYGIFEKIFDVTFVKATIINIFKFVELFTYSSVTIFQV